MNLFIVLGKFAESSVLTLFLVRIETIQVSINNSTKKGQYKEKKRKLLPQVKFKSYLDPH